MGFGVPPPDSAMVKRPVSFTLRRASATIAAAATTVKASGSGSTTTEVWSGVVIMSGRVLIVILFEPFAQEVQSVWKIPSRSTRL